MRVSLVFAVNFVAGRRADELPPIETMAPWFQTMFDVGSSVSGADYVVGHGRGPERRCDESSRGSTTTTCSSARPSRSRLHRWVCWGRTPTTSSRCPGSSR